MKFDYSALKSGDRSAAMQAMQVLKFLEISPDVIRSGQPRFKLLHIDVTKNTCEPFYEVDERDHRSLSDLRSFFNGARGRTMQEMLEAFKESKKRSVESQKSFVELPNVKSTAIRVLGAQRH